MNTTDFLDIATSIYPDNVAIIFEDKRYTFAQLNQRVNKLANALSRLGLNQGDRIAILQVNCNQCVEAYFAASKLGAIYLPLSYRAKGDELTYMLNNAEARVLLVGERYTDLVTAIRPRLETVQTCISIEKEHDGMVYYRDTLQSAPDEEIVTEVDEDDTTILMYTAGTTGFPKGVMLNHNSFVRYVLEHVTPSEPGSQERNILSVPLYHVAGIQAMMAAVYGGRTMVMERQFDPKEWMELVAQERATRAMMVPTMLKMLIDHPEFGKYDLSSLKIITYGAAPMPLPLIRRALEVFPGVSFINAFGQTETAATVTMLGPEDHVITGTGAEREKKLKRLSSIGRPIAGVEMKIVDEAGKELPVGEVGEIVARGPRVMSGYWKDQKKTAQTIDKEGWVHTGDLGYVDEEGYFFLAGRATDVIIRGGENISPDEIEVVLQEHPKVEEVAVIGVPDEEWGEVPWAVIVVGEGQTATPEEIIEFCRDRMASFKRPRSVLFVDQLPRNPMGKILRRVLRDQYGQS